MIMAIKGKNQSVQVSSHKIAQAMADYYKDLYASRNQTMEEISEIF